MNNKRTIVLVLRSGGDYSFRDVELITNHILGKWVSPERPRIVLLWDKASTAYNLGNIEIIPLKSTLRGTWSRIDLYSPEMEQYRPFLYLDLDTAIIQSVEEIFDLITDPTKFIALEDFWQGQRRIATPVVWFPANSNTIKKVWDARHSIVEGFRMDYFLRTVTTADLVWQDLTEGIVDFKPQSKILLANVPDKAILVCFHGKPRIFNATNIKWVRDYVTKYFDISNSIKEAYVINLDTRPDRMAEFQKQKFPFEVKRVAAIQEFPGSVGCTKSHVQILKQKHSFPFVIFEDDCLMLQDWTMVDKIMTQLPTDWDLLYLGANLLVRIDERYSENLFRIQGGKTTHAIIYGSQRVVDFVLKNINFTNVIDRFYEKEVQPKFNCFITYPLIATQNASYSSIANGYRNYHGGLERNYKRALGL